MQARHLLPLLVFLSVLAPARAQVGYDQLRTLTPNVRLADVASGPDGGAVVVGSVGAVETDLDGDGTPDLTVPRTRAWFLARYGASGALLWVRTLTPTTEEAGDSAALSTVTADEDGNVYVGGFFRQTLDLDGDDVPEFTAPDGQGEPFVASYGADGALRWARRGGAAQGAQPNKVEALLVDDGALVAAGTFASPLDLDDDDAADLTPEPTDAENGFLITYTLDGVPTAARRLVGREVRVRALAPGTGGGLVAAGDFFNSIDLDDDGTPDEANGSDVLRDGFVASYDLGGALAWSHAVREEDGESTEVSALAADEAGRLYVGLFSFDGTLDLDGDGTSDVSGPSAFIGSYEADGALRWALDVPGPLPAVFDMAVSASTLYAGGLLFLPFEASDGRAFVASYGLDGGPLGEGVYRVGVDGAPGTTTHGRLAVGPGGEVVVAGRFDGAVDFDGDGSTDTPDEAAGSFLFLAQQLPVPTEPGAEAPAGWSLSAAYPNPGQRRLTLDLTLATPAPARVEAFDATGRRVAVLHDGSLAAGVHPLTLDTARLPSGVYVVRAVAGGAVVTRRVTVLR